MISFNQKERQKHTNLHIHRYVCGETDSVDGVLKRFQISPEMLTF